MRYIVLIFSFLLLSESLFSQVSDENSLLSKDDLSYLSGLTKAVVEASRIFPDQKISADFGPNHTGGTLIRPGGRDCYPAFWIRDYAMSLESGFVTLDEQSHLLQLTASRQCDQTWITDAGSMVPMGAIADHIRIDDSKPIYFPGTYSFEKQGGRKFGIFPPYCDQYFFIHMAWYLAQKGKSVQFLKEEVNNIPMIERLERAFAVPPSRLNEVLVHTTPDFRGIDFGFRDVITITGDLCLPSILKFRSAVELAELFELLNRKDKVLKYKEIALRLKREIPARFLDSRGMLLASTGIGKQPDVWSTAMAIQFGLLEGDLKMKTCRFLADAYKNSTLAYKGNIRHILTCDDFSDSTAWESSLVPKSSYQNGAWWGTPTGWICQAIACTDPDAAKRLAKEYIEELRSGDFRKGAAFGAPWECYNANAPQNAVYMTTVTVPFAVFNLE